MKAKIAIVGSGNIGWALKQLLQDDRINFITPFKENKVFAFDADSYFSRPTTRILQGSIQLRKEILAN